MAKEASAQKKTAPRRSGRRGRRARWLLGLGVPLAVVVAIVLVVVYAQITATFEGRVWTLPARVYSAGLHVVTGMTIDGDTLAARLQRTGYEKVDSLPARPGQYRVHGRTLDVYVRAFAGGDRPTKAIRGTIAVDGGTVTSITGDGGRRVDAIDLEPELLSLLFGKQQEERQVVSLSQVPKSLVSAVLAAEDSRFFHHAGIDPLAILRAGFANMRRGGIVQGGSTITQQTVKNLYLNQERTLWRKVREALMAVMLDLRYPKDRILEVYLNEVYLGQRGSVAICGMQAAANYFFGRNVQDLSLAESATLAGMIRNPGGYNPFSHADRAVARRNLVLDAMLEDGTADKASVEKAKAEPLRVASGGAGYARAPYVVDFVRAQLGEMYSAQALSEEGLAIYTTIDTVAQARAEASLSKGLERLETDAPLVRRQKKLRTLQGCVVVTDPRSGAILALVGGRNYQDSQFNRAVQARRQPGSCFKPFVYLAAFEAAMDGAAGGLTPASVLDDSPFEITSGGKVWSPANYDGEFRGDIPVRAALEDSRNVPTAKAAQAVGLPRIIEAARRCGLDENFQPLPSLALGAQEVTPLEVATAYGTLATLGQRTSPRIIREVVARDGRTLEMHAPEIEKVVRPAAAFLVDDILRGVLTRGTAASSSALGFRGDAAGKTGTTDDTRDAWFVGFTPEVLALVWVGYDDNAKTGLTGAAGALPIWVDLMMHIRHRWEGSTFPEPPGIVRVEVDPESGGAATGSCPSRVAEVFAAGTEPPPCTLHEGVFKRWWNRIFHRDRPRT
ncbi:MAG TPA: PBP1A family penicillin-binding protein [Candidatus Polarisedimenticolaceae bacterium]|nr:PBP1A family penicillin-binding protein [Candidatus Polarisedimenticolaceae bacterium]